MFIRKWLLLSSIFLLFGNAAQAIPIRMDFDVSFNQVAAPTDRVIGSIVWEAASVHESIDALISIDMTIEDYNYSLEEVGFAAFDNGWVTVGGKVTTVEGLASFTEDFGIIWNRFTHVPTNFTYGTRETLPIWDGSFNLFSIEEVVIVPAPGSIPLLGAAFILLGFAVRMNARRASAVGTKRTPSMP